MRRSALAAGTRGVGSASRVELLARALAVLAGVMVAARGGAEGWGAISSAAAGVAAFAVVALGVRAGLRRYWRMVEGVEGEAPDPPTTTEWRPPRSGS